MIGYFRCWQPIADSWSDANGNTGPPGNQCLDCATSCCQNDIIETVNLDVADFLDRRTWHCLVFDVAR